MDQWSNLPQDLLVSIAKRLLSMEEFTAFGAVCRSWKLAAIKENFTRTSHQVPLLMLPEKDGTTIREFYNLKKRKIIKLSMPTLANKKLCYSSLGWLFTQSDKDLKVNLLHPINHAHIELPDVKMFKNCHSSGGLRTMLRRFGDFIVRNVVLSSSPSWTSDYIVMIQSWAKLAFWRPGDQEWTILDAGGVPRYRYLDITYYKGRFYAVDFFARIFVCEIEDPQQANARVVVPQRSTKIIDPGVIEKQYLVESAGVLLLVSRFFKETTRFKIFEVPFSSGNWTDSEVKNLGNKSLFLGYNSSFSVEASEHSECKPNCIYFTYHPPVCHRKEEEHKEMGVFNMEDEKVEPLLGKSLLTPHLWVEPSF